MSPVSRMSDRWHGDFLHCRWYGLGLHDLEVGLELLAPAPQDAVHACGTEDRAVRNLEVLGVEDERTGLEPADAAVEGDQLLERAALVEIGVVEAADHDVADVLEAVGAQEMLRRVR